ncbi:MAG: tetratricopeptide repeat protein [Chitinophagaceae bacterium]|nr:tetratricopeptide repeat protein [Chitinophagaceae bacterium]
MNKIKLGVMFLAAMVFGNFSKAQTLEEGRKFLYYEKFISAKQTFEKLLAANPNNVDAAYWLGQTMIADNDNKDVAGAKALYLKTLAANSNSALLTAGVGHMELLEGKTQDARTRFETAISLSQGKNAAVLNAVGFANANFDSKLGDASYAIEKLKQATAIKGMRDPDVWCNLGDAYRKLPDGAAALSAYETALSLDSKYARAKYRIGRIYQTQGQTQEDIYMRYYNETIAMDPSYSPVYFTLQQYYYNINVNKSADYLEKYLTAKGSDEPNACYLRTALKAAQGLYQETINKGKDCIAAGGTDPRLWGIIAYQYNKIGDSINAKTYFDEFFKRQKPEKIGPADIETYAIVLLKFPGNEAIAGTYIDKGVEMAATEEEKVALLKSIASVYEKRKQFKDAADWYKKVVMIKKNPGKTDLYNAGYNYYRVGSFQPSIEIFNQYAQKFPDDIFGHYMLGKANWGIDTTMAAGLANPYFEKAIAVGEAAVDKSKIKSQLIGSYKYMIAYMANIKKDKAGAIAFCDKALLVDPTDAETIANKDAISKMNMNPAPAKPAPKTTPAKTTGTKTPAKTPATVKKK